VSSISSRGATMLVDAASLIYRAFFSTPETVRAPDGKTINAAHGFLGMLARLVADHGPSHLVCAADEDWRPEWRVELIPTYKSHRIEGARSEQAEWAEVQLAHQVPVIFELLEGCGVAVVGSPGYEAEDVIGALIERVPKPISIVSGDRDLFQLVRDPEVRVLYPRRGVSDLAVVDEAEINRRYGIPGRAYGDYAVLRGDPSDGLPGVRGIGEKTATALIAKHGSLEAVIEAALTAPVGPLGKVASSIDYLDSAARVALITPDAPIGNPEVARPSGRVGPEVLELAGAWGLLGPVRRLAAALRGEGLPAPEPSAPAAT
jgi:5'-3' exonuclease